MKTPSLKLSLISLVVLAIAFGVVRKWDSPKPTSPAEPTVAPIIEQPPATGQQQLDLINQMVDEGVIHKFEVPATRTCLYVTPKFSELSRDDRAIFVDAISTYYFGASKPEGEVQIFDLRSGREIGVVGTTLELKID